MSTNMTTFDERLANVRRRSVVDMAGVAVAATMISMALFGAAEPAPADATFESLCCEGLLVEDDAAVVRAAFLVVGEGADKSAQIMFLAPGQPRQKVRLLFAVDPLGNSFGSLFDSNQRRIQFGGVEEGSAFGLIDEDGFYRVSSEVNGNTDKVTLPIRMLHERAD
jgi:hypothetical protein